MKKFVPVSILLLLFSCGNNETVSSPETEPVSKADSVAGQTMPVTMGAKVNFPEYKEGEINWGDTLNGLQMGLAAKGDTVFFYYKNCSKKNICMWSHTTGYGLSWNSVALVSETGDTTKMEFDVGDRERPGISETVCILPGAISAVKECLEEWISFRASQNQVQQPADGNYLLLGYYHGDRKPQDIVPAEDKKLARWSGKLSCPPVTYVYKRKPTADNQVKAAFN